MRKLDALRPIGYPGGRAWATCEQPDAFDSIADGIIRFESQCVEEGHSGGPLVDDHWRILGITQLDQRPHARAFDFTSVAKKLSDWGIPVDLVPQSTSDPGLFGQVVVGTDASCGLTVTGRVYCWGQNKSFALGIGSDSDAMTASIGIPIADRRVFRKLVGKDGSFCALTLEGSVICWGDNTSAQFGSAVPKTGIITPTQINVNLRLADLSIGGTYACGINEDRTASCWGDGPNFYDQSHPRSVRDAPGRTGYQWAMIASGDLFTCGIMLDSGLYCWGYGHPTIFGETANSRDPSTASDERIDVPDPRRIFPERTFKKVAVSSRFACAIETDGLVTCWGAIPTVKPGWAGLENSTGRQYPPETQFSALAVDNADICGVSASGKVFCWGYGDFSLGGLQDNGQVRMLSGVTDAIGISASNHVFCATTSSEKAYCWGGGFDTNRLGNGGIRFDPRDHPPFQARVSQCQASLFGVVPRFLSDHSTSYRLEPEIGADFQEALFPTDFRSLMQQSADAKAIARAAILACEVSPNGQDLKGITELVAAEDEFVEAKNDFPHEFKTTTDKIPLPPTYKTPPPSYFDRFQKALARYRGAVDAVKPH